MKKRILCTLLVALMVISTAVSCAGNGNDVEETTAPNHATTTATPTDTAAVTDAGGNVVDGKLDENGYLMDELPNDLNYNGRKVTILAWDGQSYEEFKVENLNGDIVNDSLYTRNRRVEERLGVTIDVIKTKGGSSDYEAYSSMVSADVLSSSPDNYQYDLLAAYSRTAAMCAYQGLTQNLMDTKYFDVEKPWWPKTLVDQSTVDGKLYFCSGDISLSIFHNLSIIYFNKTLSENFGTKADDLYQMTLDGKWTLDKLIELSKGAYADLDNDNQKSEGDQFGYIGANTQAQPLVWGCGINAIETGENGEMRVSPDFVGEKMQSIVEKIFPWLHNEPDAYYASKTSIGNNAFAEGRLLFFSNSATYTMSKFNVDGLSYGILPEPKFDEAQEDYYSVIGNTFTLYAIANTHTDADMCSAVLEAMGSEGYRLLSPAIFESAMKIKYASDALVAQMYDIIRAGVVFDNGRIYSGVVNNVFTNTFNNAIKANNTAWLTTIEPLLTEMNAHIKSLNEVFASLE